MSANRMDLRSIHVGDSPRPIPFTERRTQLQALGERPVWQQLNREEQERQEQERRQRATAAGRLLDWLTVGAMVAFVVVVGFWVLQGMADWLVGA